MFHDLTVYELWLGPPTPSSLTPPASLCSPCCSYTNLSAILPNPPVICSPRDLCPERSFITIPSLHQLHSHSLQVSHEMREFPDLHPYLRLQTSLLCLILPCSSCYHLTCIYLLIYLHFVISPPNKPPLNTSFRKWGALSISFCDNPYG